MRSSQCFDLTAPLGQFMNPTFEEDEFGSLAILVAHLRVFAQLPYPAEILRFARPEDLFAKYPELLTERFISDVPRFEARIARAGSLVN